MSIKVNVPHSLQKFTNGKKMVEVVGNTVGDCLLHLVEQFPTIKKELFDEHGKLLGYLTIFVNGHSAYPEELAKPVKDGDELSLVLIVAGG